MHILLYQKRNVFYFAILIVIETPPPAYSAPDDPKHNAGRSPQSDHEQENMDTGNNMTEVAPVAYQVDLIIFLPLHLFLNVGLSIKNHIFENERSKSHHKNLSKSSQKEDYF